jgi:uncharacterized protein YqeY
MSLIQQIKQDQLYARKAKDVLCANALTTLIGEAEMVGKNANREVTDTEVQAMLKKFVNNIELTIKVLNPGDHRIPDLLSELEIYEKYQLAQMDANSLESAIVLIKNEINAGPKDMGKIMSALRAKFAGQYDGKLANELVKKVLQ